MIIDISNKRDKMGRKLRPESRTLDEVFRKNSPVTQKVLRGYVERHEAVAYICTSCGSDGQWLKQKISLELDHIDGDNTNNELTNLRYLCPNCHALTDTYRGKNKHNKMCRDYTPKT